MLFNFMKPGRNSDTPGSRDQKRGKSPVGEATQQANPQQECTGRDSLTKLRAAAKGQRVRQQNQDHWFKADQPSEIVVPTTSATCSASIPEADRQKAIEELLSMGIDHFTVRHQD